MSSGRPDFAAETERRGLELFGPDALDDDPGLWDDLLGGLAEARFEEDEHPRDRLGRWVRGLGLRAWEVGGAVRDPMLGREPKDVDYMVEAAPEDIARAVEATGHTAVPLTVRDRLVGVRAFGPELPDEGVELAPPRVERSTGPSRHDFVIEPHPEPTSDGARRADATRRDFTVNAMYRDAATGELLDPLGGAADMEARRLRTTSPDSFVEDPLRILRGLRFMSQHGLDLEAGTEDQMREHAGAVTALTRRGVSGTARDELDKLLAGEHVGKSLRKARDLGVLASFLPELAPTIGFDQDSKYHDLTADEHIISVVETAPAAPPEVRLAALFHDAGKPESAWRGADGRLHYYANPEEGKEDHAVVGERIAREALNRLRYDKETIRRVTTLVREHMLKEAGSRKAAKARRLRQRVGDEALLRSLLAHRRADVRGKGEDVPTGEDDIDRLERLLDETRDDPTTIRALAVDGRDLTGLGLSGPAVGQTLRELLDIVVGDPRLNRRDILLRHVRSGLGEELREAWHVDFDPHLHPRDRRGKFIDTLGKIPDVKRLGRGGGSVNVKRTPFTVHARKGGFTVKHDLTGDTKDFDTPEEVAGHFDRDFKKLDDRAALSRELGEDKAKRERAGRERERARSAGQDADRKRREEEFDRKYPKDEQGRRYYYRLKSPTQSDEVAAQQVESGEIWGRAPTNTFAGIAPKVQAYMGRLPEGEEGVEFVTSVPVDEGAVRGRGDWSMVRRPGAASPAVGEGEHGLRSEDEFAKLGVTITRVTQGGAASKPVEEEGPFKTKQRRVPGMEGDGSRGPFHVVEYQSPYGGGGFGVRYDAGGYSGGYGSAEDAMRGGRENLAPEKLGAKPSAETDGAEVRPLSDGIAKVDEELADGECHDVVVGVQAWARAHGFEPTIHHQGSHSFVTVKVGDRDLILDPVAEPQHLGKGAAWLDEADDEAYTSPGVRTFNTLDEYLKSNPPINVEDVDDYGKWATDLLDRVAGPALDGLGRVRP